jgi:uncharacterized protein YggT (Ycf19 family)
LNFTHFVKIALSGVEITIRFGTVALSFLLVIQSLGSRFLPPSRQYLLWPVNVFTYPLVKPFRRILPLAVCNRQVDYSPLLSAIVLLLIGYGFHEFFMMILKTF